MPKSNIDGSIEITLQGHGDSMRLHIDVNSTVVNIKEVWREYACCHGHRPLFCLFDGFLLEDEATLVGLGVVGGDTILLFSDGSPPDDSKLLPLVKNSKRSAEEISVGLNVLFGEEERLEVLTSPHNQQIGALFSHRLSTLQRTLKDLRHEAQVTGRFDMNQITKACFEHVYGQGRHLEDRDLVKLLPQADDQNVAEVLEVLKDFRNTNWTLPGPLTHQHNGHVDYDMVFIGPERNANFTNYLAFPPTVQLYGLDWRTTLLDLMESYREYSGFNIPDEFDYLVFNNEEYSLDERVFDVIINGFSQIPFLPTHLHFCFQFDIENSKDMRNVDDLVSFIEGEGDECGNEPKKKKKKKQKKKDSSPPVKEESQVLIVEPLTELVENNPSKKSENDSTGPISLLKENHKINLETDNKEKLMNRDDEKKVKLETLVDVQVSIQSELLLEKKRLVNNKEENELNLVFLREKDTNLINTITRTDLEISNISNGISSCDSEIHDLEMRLQRVKLLRGTLTDNRNKKVEKLKALEEEKRQLTQKINTDSLLNRENRSNTLRNIESLNSYQEGTEKEIERMDLSTDGSSKCPVAVQYLDSEIRNIESRGGEDCPASIKLLSLRNQRQRLGDQL